MIPNQSLVLLNDSSKSFKEKVEWAIQRYRDKYGHEPTVCYVNPKDAVEGVAKVGEASVIPVRTVLTNYFWVSEFERGK